MTTDQADEVMTEDQADEVLRTKLDRAPKIRLAAAVLEACRGATGQEQREIDARLRAKAERVRGARVAVVIGS